MLQALDDVNSERAGSLDTRSDIYRATIAYTAQHPLPLLGYGIKPSEDGLVASVATHSTYIGIVFRAGWIGAVALAVLLIGGLVQSIRQRNAVGVAVLVLVAIWSLFEDVDGGHLVPVAFAFVFAATRVGVLDRDPPPPVRAGTRTTSASRS